MGLYEEEQIEGRFCRSWLPTEEARSVVVVVHGFCEHGGRYGQLAEELQRQGYAVYVGDLRGHGRSAGARTAIRRFEEYLDDVEPVIELASKRCPGRPVFLLGHSMGGAIALWLAITRRPRVQGLIVSAPAVYVSDDVLPWLRRLASVFSVVAPWLRLVRVSSKRLSRDPAVIADFDSDPWAFHGRFPVRTGAEILRIGQEIQRTAHALTLPMLLLHGTGDGMTDPVGSQMVYEEARSADKTMRLYPGLYHDLFHEPEHAAVTADVLAWLDGRSDGIVRR